MKVLVVGDFVYDKYNYGVSNRLSREASLPIFQRTHTEHCLGGAANLALNCHHHADTTLYAAVGPEPMPMKVPFRMVNLPGKTVTTVKERFIMDDKHVFRTDEEKYEPINIDDIETEGYDVLILSDYNQGAVHSPQKLIKDSKCPVFVDPRGLDWYRYAGAYCLTPNRDEFELVCGELTVENIRTAIRTYSLQAMLVTLGADGVIWVTADDEIRVKGMAEKTIDVNGAGDTFNAIFASYFDPSDVRKTLEIAVRAAGIAASKLGTYAVTKEDIGLHVTSALPASDEVKCVQTTDGLDQSTQESRPLSSTECLESDSKDGIRVPDIASTLTIVEQYVNESFTERREQKIVFTNGIFDLLHASHLKFLRNASRLGDKLIVGLNSDSSATRYKRQPFHNQHRRKELLEGFSCVDKVIIFDELTPRNLIRRIRPDVYAKGSDYKLEDLIAKDLVGKAVIIQSDLSITTTKIMETCHQRMSELEGRK